MKIHAHSKKGHRSFCGLDPSPDKWIVLAQNYLAVSVFVPEKRCKICLQIVENKTLKREESTR